MSRNSTLCLSLAITATFAVGATPARADLTQTDGRVSLQASSVVTPARGSSMAQVEAEFGAPQARHDAVGSPAIARWDYPQFTVYFENSHVIHAVAH